ncbi:MAG: hypothetical protein COA38_20465 [Fluviicola sp.]|nr:MAG: hypothetical protein COA38_20465 [Fluviicola sp.]
MNHEQRMRLRYGYFVAEYGDPDTDTLSVTLQKDTEMGEGWWAFWTVEHETLGGGPYSTPTTGKVAVTKMMRAGGWDRRGGWVDHAANVRGLPYGEQLAIWESENVVRRLAGGLKR